MLERFVGDGVASDLAGVADGQVREVLGELGLGEGEEALVCQLTVVEVESLEGHAWVGQPDQGQVSDRGPVHRQVDPPQPSHGPALADLYHALVRDRSLMQIQLLQPIHAPPPGQQPHPRRCDLEIAEEQQLPEVYQGGALGQHS